MNVPEKDPWLGKPYFSLDAWCKQVYGQKVWKLSLQAGLTCPNRDGTLGRRGCIFCSEGGSGDFALPVGSPQTGIRADLEQLITAACEKHAGSPFIAYFQAFTNTYGPLPYLAALYERVLQVPGIIGISIATRPDCISPEIVCLLKSLQKKYPGKRIWVELGLQTMHDTTAHYLRRGYDLPCFEQAMQLLGSGKSGGTDTSFDPADRIPVIVHVIIGLPGETPDMLYQTIAYLNTFPLFGIKLQLLHVLAHTDLAEDYRQGLFQTLSLDEYLALTAGCLARLSPDIVIHRVTGDGPKSITLAPKWSFDKKNVLNSLHRYMKNHALSQGCLFRN